MHLRGGVAQGFREKRNGKSRPRRLHPRVLCSKPATFTPSPRVEKECNKSLETSGSGRRAPTCRIRDSNLPLAWLVNTTESLCVISSCFAAAHAPLPPATFGPHIAISFLHRPAGNSAGSGWPNDRTRSCSSSRLRCRSCARIVLASKDTAVQTVLRCPRFSAVRGDYAASGILPDA